MGAYHLYEMDHFGSRDQRGNQTSQRRFSHHRHRHTRPFAQLHGPIKLFRHSVSRSHGNTNFLISIAFNLVCDSFPDNIHSASFTQHQISFCFFPHEGDRNSIGFPKRVHQQPTQTLLPFRLYTHRNQHHPYPTFSTLTTTVTDTITRTTRLVTPPIATPASYTPTLTPPSSVFTNQAQPDPKCPAAVALNSFLKFSNDP